MPSNLKLIIQSTIVDIIGAIKFSSLNSDILPGCGYNLMVSSYDIILYLSS